MGKENRQEWRLSETNAIVVSVVASAGSPELIGKKYISSTADVSSGGMQLICKERLPTDAYVEIMVAVKNPPSAFKLNGQVRWTMADDAPGKYFTGIQFATNDENVMRKWTALIENRILDDAESELIRRVPPDEENRIRGSND